MITSEFKQEYQRLNPEQKRAVDAIEGPVMVVAGPGTGKTQVLTLRIANILAKTDTKPENILALTFTEAAATNMRRRLARLIGASAYRVRIETFHGFCNTVIKTYPEFFPNIIGSANITEVETADIIEELVLNLPLNILRPWGDPMFYVREIGSKISELKREGFSPSEFKNLVEKEEKEFMKREDLHHTKGAHNGKMKAIHLKTIRILEKNKELALIYESYQETLHKKRLYDWSDMILEVLEALKSEKGNELKMTLQEEHQYVLVDEHQDTNNAQNKILELLLDFYTNPNIFIVGDEKQAIFRFQGASVENFLYLQKIYQNIEYIELSRNYRSNQGILDAAHSLIASKIPLKAEGEKTRAVSGPQIFTACLKNKTVELHFVATEIQKSIQSGMAPHEIAVLFRNNRDAFGMAESLSRMGIKFSIESDEDLLSEKFVRKFLAVLNAIHKYGDDSALIPLLHTDEFGIDPLDAYKLIHASHKTRKPIYEIMQERNLPEEISNKESIVTFSELLKKFARDAKQKSLMDIFEKVLRESGILNAMLQSKDAEAFLGIERLFEEGKRIALNKPDASLEDFMHYLRSLETHKIFIKRPKHLIKEGAVRLMTVHKSKGLEFEEVYLIHASEDAFGDKSKTDFLPLIKSVYKKLNQEEENGETEEELNDERRLFYVALTRAKGKVVISWPSTDENGREILGSVFTSELREDRVQKLDTSHTEKELEAHPEILYAEKAESGVKEMTSDFIADLFRNQPLSVSALNNYLSCPWKYFYRNLLRIPSIPERHQLYGTAMHAAVQDLFAAMQERREEKEINEEFLIDSYKRHLGNCGLTKLETKEAEKRGVEALSGWYKWAKKDWVEGPVIPEFSITVSMPIDDFQLNLMDTVSSILLSGKLDKVEFISDTKVAVTDYKTGKQKSRNEIEGKTKNSSGDIKRQLIFYKLLLDLDSSTSSKLRGASQLEMQKGIIEFLEPNDSGNYKREEYEIADQEISELKKTIQKMAEEVMTLSFWNSTCDDKTCEYCGYRKLLKK